ncbi:MAG: exo-rhamnogalacturonan lyase family protein [Candidatus Zipacnadales bacterium]
MVPPLQIENLRAWHLLDEPGEPPNRIMITWTTNRPAEGSIAYSLAGPEAMQQTGLLEEGRGAVNNHVLMLPPELKASAYQLTITCTEPLQETYPAQSATVHYMVWRDVERHYRENGGKELKLPLTRIPLRVEEPTGSPRTAWPVSSGVPLPPATLRADGRCRVLTAEEEVVPAQFTPLAMHPDGVHVKWLLVDFLANTQAGEATSYTLECMVPSDSEGVETLPKHPVKVKSVPLEDHPALPVGAVGLPVEIDTGPLQLTLDQGGFAPFAEVMINGMFLADADATACGIELTDAEGRVYSSALTTPEEVLVEAAGPLRATVCVRGRLANKAGESYMRYLCRMHFYAGQPYVRTVLSLDNDVTDPGMSLIRRLCLRVPAELTGARVSVGVAGRALELPLGQRVLQEEDYHCVAGDREGRRAEGWLMARGGANTLAVAVRNFWQLYPKGFNADETGIVVDLLPELPNNQYAGASEDDITKLYYWREAGCYKIRTGVRLTTELAVDFDPAPAGPEYPRGSLWQAPLFGACLPEWYCKSGAFGPLAPRAEGKFEVYERNLDEAFSKFLQRREDVREYGFMNYGDWFGERKWNWGNVEYDTQWALALNFARTGNLAMLRRAEEAEWHNADIDTTHYWPNAAEVGRVWTHCTGHTGGYSPDDWKGMGGFNRGPRDTGHTYAQGHFYLYALTGERRYWETGRKVADWLANHTTNFSYYSERNVGWPMIGLVGAYDATSNPFYLNGAKLMADMAMWTQVPETGGWGHWIDPSECKHDPRCWGCKTFMTGVLLHGLRMYDRAEPRNEIKRVILKNTDFVWRICYIPQDNGFIYSQCKSFCEKGQPWTLSLVGDGLSYGCLIDPTHKHKPLLLRAAQAFMYQSGISDFGKGFTQATCFVPLMLHDMDALGLTQILPPDK